MRFAPNVGLLDRLANLLERCLYLWDEHKFCSAGDAAHLRQVARVAPHRLDEKGSVVGGGGVFDLIYGIQDGVQRCIHADGDVGAIDVVVNGAGDADGREA